MVIARLTNSNHAGAAPVADRMTISDESPDGSIFRCIDLPAEIRNRIYGYVCYRESRIELAHLMTPSISCTCHQLQQEALPIFFDMNVFVVHIKVLYAGRLDGLSRTKRGFVVVSKANSEGFGAVWLLEHDLTSFEILPPNIFRVKKFNIQLLYTYSHELSKFRTDPTVQGYKLGAPLKVRLARCPTFDSESQSWEAFRGPCLHLSREEIADVKYFEVLLKRSMLGKIERGREGFSFKDLQDMAKTTRALPPNHTRLL
jgi:hypothetical protein